MFVKPTTGLAKRATAAVTAMAMATLGLAACSGQSATTTAAGSSTASAPQAASTTTAPAPQDLSTTLAAHDPSTTPAPDSSATPTAPGAWLTADQLPFAATMHWEPEGVQAFTGSTMGLPVVWACQTSDGTAIEDAKTVLVNQYRANGQPAEVGAWVAPIVFQSYYSFPNSTVAHAMYSDILHDLSTCSTPDGDTVRKATKTESMDNGFAYVETLRNADGTPAQEEGNYNNGSDYHTYVVVVGDFVDILMVTGGPSVDSTSQDKATLALMTSALS